MEARQGRDDQGAAQTVFQPAQGQETSRLAVAGRDGRRREILESRWLAEEKKTLHELADQFGVSAERIRQIENDAIKKLRTAMA